MPNINLGKIRNKLQIFYKSNFPVILYVSLAVLLAIGFSTMRNHVLVASIVAVVLFGISLLYYYSYFKKYRLLTDTFSHYQHYYYEVFSTWGILAFNILFILIFAFVGSVLAIMFPNLGFGKASFYSLLIFLIQTIVDGISLGLVGSYSIDFSNLKMEGLFAKSYIYLVNLLINIAFIASLATVISETLQTRKELKNVLELESLNEEFFDNLTPFKVKEILKLVKNGTFHITKHESELLKMLEKSNSKEAKDIMLQIFQSTNDATVFKSCLLYFSDKRDYRFQRVCKRIKNPEFVKLLKSV